MGSHFSFGLYLLASITLFLDLADVLLRVYLRRVQTVARDRGKASATSVPLEIGDFTPYEAQLHLRPYAILVSVHNTDRDSLTRFLAALAPYGDRVWVIDDASTDDTWDRLQHSGVHALRSWHNHQKPGAIKALLAALPSQIATVVVLDPDARIVSEPSEFERVLFEFQRSGMAALCPHIAVRKDGALARFQQMEYCLSFGLARKALADFTITSGIAVYRRDALEHVLDHHSLSVYAEDLENALLLLLRHERIYYDGRLVVETDGMSRLRTLFSQRVGWSLGLIRVYASHWRALLRRSGRSFAFTYQYVVYMGIFVLLFHPLKLVSVGLLTISALNCVDNLLRVHLVTDSTFTNQMYFLTVYFKYTALALALIPLAVPKTERRHVLPIVPFFVFYSIGQIVPATVGYLNWFALKIWGRRVYRDHYQPVAP